MDKTNAKVLTLSFATAGALVALTAHVLLRSFGAAFGVVARLTDSDLVKHGFPIGLGLLVFAVLQFNPRILVWGDEVVAEIRKVVWPSRKDTVAMTIVVCVMVLISSVIITVFDVASGFFIKTLTHLN